MRSAFCTIVILALSQAAMAAGVVYSNRSAFEAALVAHKTYSFDVANGFPAAPAGISLVDGGLLQFSSNGGPASLDAYGAAGNQALTGRSSNQVDRNAALTITPSGHQNAIGFDILDLGANGVEGAYITVSDATDRPVLPFLVQDNDANPATPVFFGVIWDMDMTGVDVHAENLLCAALFCPTPNLIDNVTIVPEPGMFLALPGAWLLLQRRRGNSVIARG